MDKLGEENVVEDFLSRLPTQLVEGFVDDYFLDEYLFSLTLQTPWFFHIVNYLVAGQIPPHFSPREKRQLVHRSFPYSWVAGYLFYIGPNNIMRGCIREDEVYDIFKSCHHEPCGGHFATKRTALKILTIGYYWPTLHKDLVKYTRRFDRCQRMGRPTKT